MRKSIVNKAVTEAINEHFSVDTSGDEAFLKDEKHTWDDLNTLKDELGSQVLYFMREMKDIVENPDVVNSLGDLKPRFEQDVGTFFSDLNDFSAKVKELRVQHESKTGPITTLVDFNLYNRLSIGYNSLFMELIAFTSPTMASIVLTIHQASTAGKSQSVGEILESKGD